MEIQSSTLISAGFVLENERNAKDALVFYESMIPYILNLSPKFANTPENHLWTERLLFRHCALSSRHVTAHATQPDDFLSSKTSIPANLILSPYRAYAKVWDTRSSLLANKFPPVSKIWHAYYETLSLLLQNGIIEPVFHSKKEQSMELKRIEAIYEAILLKEVSFPRADQVNTQVESWVDQVMTNWRIMGGLAWLESDLGKADKIALGRGVLEVGL